MIKNVVFDFGQVLVRFEPEYMTGQYIKDENDIKLMSQVLFDRLIGTSSTRGRYLMRKSLPFRTKDCPNTFAKKPRKFTTTGYTTFRRYRAWRK